MNQKGALPKRKYTRPAWLHDQPMPSIGATTEVWVFPEIKLPKHIAELMRELAATMQQTGE